MKKLITVCKMVTQLSWNKLRLRPQIYFTQVLHRSEDPAVYAQSSCVLKIIIPNGLD